MQQNSILSICAEMCSGQYDDKQYSYSPWDDMELWKLYSYFFLLFVPDLVLAFIPHAECIFS